MSKTEQISISVGAVIFREEKVLLIKRAKAPFLGEWSIPGGHLEYGEELEAGVHREVAEETGVKIDVISILDAFNAINKRGHEVTSHMVIVDYVAEWREGEPVAASDAMEAEFVPLREAIERLSWDTTRQAVTKAAEIRAAYRMLNDRG